MINTIDGQIDYQTSIKLYDCVTQLSYQYGEADSAAHDPTGLVSNLDPGHWAVQTIHSVVEPYVSELKMYRSYVNIFAPGEKPYYHIDNDSGLTVLYYSNLNFDLDQGGETSFVIDNQLVGVLPIPGRVVVFPSFILHTATSFRRGHRFSIVLKYK